MVGLIKGNLASRISHLRFCLRSPLYSLYGRLFLSDDAGSLWSFRPLVTRFKIKEHNGAFYLPRSEMATMS